MSQEPANVHHKVNLDGALNLAETFVQDFLQRYAQWLRVGGLGVRDRGEEHVIGSCPLQLFGHSSLFDYHRNIISDVLGI